MKGSIENKRREENEMELELIKELIEVYDKMNERQRDDLKFVLHLLKQSLPTT